MGEGVRLGKNMTKTLVNSRGTMPFCIILRIVFCRTSNCIFKPLSSISIADIFEMHSIQESSLPFPQYPGIWGLFRKWGFQANFFFLQNCALLYFRHCKHNKLGSLEATLVRNYEPLTDRSKKKEKNQQCIIDIFF